MGTAITHSVPDRVTQSFVIFDIWALAERHSARISKITYDGLTRAGTECCIAACTHAATVGVKGLMFVTVVSSATLTERDEVV